MQSITWEEVLRGDSIPVYLCFPFFMTVLLAQPCTLSSLLGSLCQGVACQEGPAWPLTPTMYLDNFPLSLKKPVSAPNESHNHSCDPATGSECPGSTDRAMPGTRVILGVRKENGWSSQAISVTFSCKLPRCSWTSWPVQHVGLTHSPTCAQGNCVWMCKHSCVRARALGTRGREKPDTVDSPPSTVGAAHEDICSSGFLLPQVIFSLTTRYHKAFGGFPFLDFLIGPFFLMSFFLAQKKWSNSHNHLLMMIKVAVNTVSNWQFGRLKIIIHLNACKLKHVSTFLGHSQVK